MTNVSTGDWAARSPVTTVFQRKRWVGGGLTNGALLEKAEQEFDVFLKGDRNLSFQQEVSRFNIAVLVLHAESTQLHDTLLLMPQVLTLLPTLQPGQVVDIRP